MNKLENIKKLLKRIDKEIFIHHPENVISDQINKIINGSHFVELVKPARIGDGIIRIDQSKEKLLLESFEIARLSGRFSKFIPASGAATRMFSKLIPSIQKFYDKDFDYIIKQVDSDKEAEYLIYTIINLNKFAFYKDILSFFSSEKQFNEILKSNPIQILQLIINHSGLNYSFTPKALLKFHKYENNSRTSFIEHLFESAEYQSDVNNEVSIHFTISENHQQVFKKEEQHIKDYDYLNKFSFNIFYSFQKSSTDSITLTDSDEVYFAEDGNPLFRPAGHGALLENLNDLKADVVFIKNIDNVCVDRLKPITVKYKKLLAGLLLLLQKQVFEYLTILEKEEDTTDIRNEIMSFSNKLLNISQPDGFNTISESQQRKFLFDKLNRPIRVCGVVKNEGDPGGAPFWIKTQSGNIELQIVEQSQINISDDKQNLIFNNSTHFNPVDIVAGLRDYKGKNFDLTKFRDDNSYMIVNKSIGSNKIKSLELPGLWNGGMANWISVFVEVPPETFNPVKELIDLLKLGHI
jgi:hypothetical protein